jgi:Rha family phage regulatory protein
MTQNIPGASAPILAVANGLPTAISTDIAAFFGKRHNHVLRDIRTLIGKTPEEFNALNFEAVEILNAKGEKRPAYRLTRDGFTLLAMGFTGKKAIAFKLAYIDAFNEMEAELRKNRLTLAHRLAAQAVAKVSESVFEAVLANPCTFWKHDRYLLSFNYNPKNPQTFTPVVSVVDNNAFVMTLERLARAIGDPDHLADDAVLAALAAACCQRLAKISGKT